MFQINKLLIIFYLLSYIFVSCTTSKQMVYLNDLNESKKLADSLTNSKINFETPIQKNDLLWITVGGPNSLDLVALNSGMGFPPGSAGGAVAQQGQFFGYLVESDGYIKMPYIGRIKVEGLNRTTVEELLRKEFEEYTKEPVVNVRFLNYRVTVMGEVNRPGTFSLSNERITVLEALGMAGDLTIMGKRETITIIREVDGKREIGKINLLSSDLFLSPYYYLRTNDVVYVEPTPARFFARERLPQFLTLAAGTLSLVLTAITISRL